MRGLYFSQVKLNEKSLGAVAKVLDEIKGFETAGFEMDHVNLAPLATGLRSIHIGRGIMASIPFTCVFSPYKYKAEYAGYDFYYFRFEAADRWFIRFLKDLKENNPKAKIIIEFPDYPNTNWMNGLHYIGIRLKDHFARNKYSRYVDRFAVLNRKYSEIYGVKTVPFINGIVVDRIPKRCPINEANDDIHMIGVATMFPFHGFERILKGMEDYYDKTGDKRKVIFHIVGDGPGNELPRYKKLAEKYGISPYVVFEGRKQDTELTDLFNRCSLAVCSLGMFRYNINTASSLKTREYLSRGLPLITGCNIDILEDTDFPYVIQFPNDASPIDIGAVVEFHDRIYHGVSEDKLIEDIRNFAVSTCDVSVALRNVTDYILESKDKHSKELKLSVITVVYNAASRLPGTIESVVSQDYDNVEYIIKDGGSTDGTVDVIKEYAGKYDNIRYVSGKDDGIYDAMNMAVAMATGDALEFLNAGDKFVAPDVVSSAMKVMYDTDSDVVYGDVLYIHQDGRENVRTYPQPCSNKLYFLTGDAINHQVMFARRHLFGDAPFDNSYRICADREWMLRKGVYSSQCKMRALGFVVASYPLDGLSVIQSDVYKKDADRCIKKYMLWGYPIYAVFEYMRANAFLAELLHKVYVKLYVKR